MIKQTMPNKAECRPSLHVCEQLVRNAMVLALGQLLELALAIAPAIGAETDALHTLVVFRQPGGAMHQALGLQLIQRILELFTRLQVRRMVLREVLKEGRAVGETHVTASKETCKTVRDLDRKWL